MFGIGAKVKCIDDRFLKRQEKFLVNKPVFLGLYTIRTIERGHRGCGVRLVEIYNPDILVKLTSTGEIIRFEPLFLARRFVLAAPIAALPRELERELELA